MRDKVFLDTNILIYLYSENELEKLVSALESNCDAIITEDMNSGQVISSRLRIENPFTANP